MEFQIILESHEFGREVFSGYESLDEALASVKQLAEDASECVDDDGVERLVGIFIHSGD